MFEEMTKGGKGKRSALIHDLGKLKPNQYMQELTTGLVQVRSHAMARNKVSNSIAGSKAYKGRTMTEADKEAQMKFKIQTKLVKELNERIMRDHGHKLERRASKFWANKEFERLR